MCRGRCRRTGRAVAIKKIKRFLTDPKRLRAEITALRRVKQHPNIVELIDVFETTREGHLVLELCTGGELFERLAEKGAYWRPTACATCATWRAPSSTCMSEWAWILPLSLAFDPDTLLLMSIMDVIVGVASCIGTSSPRTFYYRHRTTMML